MQEKHFRSQTLIIRIIIIRKNKYKKETYKRYTPAKFTENGNLLPKTSYPLHENKEVYFVYYHSAQKALKYGVCWLNLTKHYFLFVYFC